MSAFTQCFAEKFGAKHWQNSLFNCDRKTDRNAAMTFKESSIVNNITAYLIHYQ